LIGSTDHRVRKDAQMKIRHPFFIRLTAFLMSWIIRVWIGTLEHRHRSLGGDVDPRGRRRDLAERFIYAFWHENLLLPPYFYGHPSIKVLISQHADGELIARVCRHMGFGTIRGSTTRGGMEALRQMLRASQRFHLGVVPDGPRGPRRALQLGPIYLASRTGVPIVPSGIGFDRPWRARSWDRFALPRPWSRARVVTAVPIVIPPDLDKDQLEIWRQRVEAVMQNVSQIAEDWAATGKWPVSGQSTRPAELGGRNDQEQAA
jgi:lysophospholipid acyltransferase (LPLAT)-like uncharacterized protein